MNGQNHFTIVQLKCWMRRVTVSEIFAREITQMDTDKPLNRKLSAAIYAICGNEATPT
jgi:hypothetical protein